MLLMDSIWTKQQEWQCVIMPICLTLVEHTFWHLFCGGQLLRHASSFRWSVVRVLFLGHESCHPCCSSTCRSPGRVLCVCVRGERVGVKGAPWGEAGQSSPVAALGQGMAIQDACLGSQPNLTVASLSFRPVVPSYCIHRRTCAPL